VNQKVYLYGFCLFEKILIYEVCETVDVVNSIVFLLLIQSHGQARTASPALVQKNSNGLNFLVVKIFGDHLGRRWGYFNHIFLLVYIKIKPLGHSFFKHAKLSHGNRICQWRRFRKLRKQNVQI